eukprot:3614167-Karenia_brevis.AAC.1
MAGPRQSGAYNMAGTAPMDLDEPPRSGLQLPKIGGQDASASAAIVPKGPEPRVYVGPKPGHNWAVFKQPPLAVVRE